MQRKEIREESQLPPYTLPDVLRDAKGNRIESAEAWQRYRSSLLDLFSNYVYGRTPTELPAVEVVQQSVERGVLNGLAIRKQVRLRYSRADEAIEVDLLTYLPMKADSPPGVFLGLNFYGNQIVHSDPGIVLSRAWVLDRSGAGIVDHRATEASRAALGGWPIEQILESGYAVATACYGDFDPDYDDGCKNGVHSLYPLSAPGGRAPTSWGAIGAWAWGLSRLLDHLREDKDVDGDRVMVFGHSRLGKTAIWAAAQDTRFAAGISNNSGCGGASPSRRRFGETVAAINEDYPHWFCPRFADYNNNEAALPVDQHQLLALIAPRALYVASASEDLHADPYGEYLSAYHASKVYPLFGYEAFDSSQLPPVNQPITGQVSFHLRQGPHALKPYDWEQYIKFADRQVTGLPVKEM